MQNEFLACINTIYVNTGYQLTVTSSLSSNNTYSMLSVNVHDCALQ